MDPDAKLKPEKKPGYIFEELPPISSVEINEVLSGDIHIKNDLNLKDALR